MERPNCRADRSQAQTTGTKGKRFVSKAWDGTDAYSGLEAICRLDHVSFEGRVVESIYLLVLLIHVRKACLI